MTTEEFIADFRDMTLPQLNAALEYHLDTLALIRRRNGCNNNAFVGQSSRVNAIRKLIREKGGKHA